MVDLHAIHASFSFSLAYALFLWPCGAFCFGLRFCRFHLRICGEGKQAVARTGRNWCSPPGTPSTTWNSSGLWVGMVEQYAGLLEVLKRSLDPNEKHPGHWTNTASRDTTSESVVGVATGLQYEMVKASLEHCSYIQAKIHRNGTCVMSIPPAVANIVLLIDSHPFVYKRTRNPNSSLLNELHTGFIEGSFLHSFLCPPSAMPTLSTMSSTIFESKIAGELFSMPGMRTRGTGACRTISNMVKAVRRPKA